MTNKDVIFIALAPLDDNADGVANKIKMQARGIAENGLSVDILAYDKNGPALYETVDGEIKLVEEFDNKYSVRWKSLFYGIDKLLCSRSYKKAYIRYPRCSKAFVYALKQLKQSDVDITLEIPTYPMNFDKPSDLRDFLVKVMYVINEKVYSPKLKNYVSKIYEIGTKVDYIYGIPAVTIPNGVDAKAYQLRKPDSLSDDIHLVLSSNFYKHHGIDRLVTGLGEYKKAGGKDFYLELVGDGPEMGRIQQLVDENDVKELVSFHGYKSGKEYDEVYNHCQIASSCLGFPRMGYPDASPLKSREYMLRGIPYIYCYNEIGLDVNEFKYAYRLSEEDGPVNIKKVIEFYNSYKDSQDKAAEEMREYSLKTFTWKNILKDI